MSVTGASAESVRVIVRFRPQRSDLLRGGGQGGSTVASGKGGLGHVGKGGAVAAKIAAATEGYKLDFDDDHKSLTYHSPITVSSKGEDGDTGGALERFGHWHCQSDCPLLGAQG
jgi:hypothetical protein